MKPFDLIVIASPTELSLVREELAYRSICRDVKIIITGVGAINVFQALKNVDKDTRILNIGFCGSPDFPLDSRVEVGLCELSHKVDYKEDNFVLEEGNLNICYTGIDFATEGKEGCVYDMELAFICAMGFDVQAVKYVSDNMNYNQYANTVNEK